MPEPFEATAARKISALERTQRDQGTIEVGWTMGDVIGTIMAFPELRGFWPFSSVNESGNVADLSFQGRTLTNTGSCGRGVYNNIIPYGWSSGAGQYFSRADEAGLDIASALTFGGWFCHNTVNPSYGGLMGKYNSGAGHTSYLIYTNAGDLAVAVLNAGAATGVAGSALTLGWSFVVARFTPSTELALFQNKIKTTNTTSIPASIDNSDAPLYILTFNGNGGWFNGGASMCFLTAYALPDSMINRLFNVSRGFFGV